MPDTNAATSAHTALREAAAALSHGRNATRAGAPLGEPGYKLLGAEVAAALDCLAGLLRSVGLEPVPTSSVSHEYHSLLQQVVYSASLARRVAGPDQDSGAPGMARTDWALNAAPDD
jgi:hypothetical protein